MSFSKAKLKRFNEITVTDSPYSDRPERKDSIRKLMKELSKDAEFKKSKDPAPVIQSSSETESIKSQSEATTVKTKSCTLRLFRTPSLPRRLKFNRQHSDLTPKEKSETAKSLFKDHDKKDKEALEAANIELNNKNETLKEYEQIMEEMRKKSYQLSCSNRHKDEIIDEMEIRINELTKELCDCDRANDLLKNISEKSIEKIDVLEAEIRLILKNHENEIDFLIEINAEEEKRSECFKTKNVKLKDDYDTVKKELIDATDEVDVLRENLQRHVEKLQEIDDRCKRTMDENLLLLSEIDEISHQAEKDMLKFIEENEKMMRDLDNLRSEKSNLLNELSTKEGIISALNDEVIANDVDLDAKRDDIKCAFNADLKSISNKYEQQITTLKEVNDMKIKEIESIFVLERAKLIADHSELVKTLKTNNQKEIDRINETAEEKIRISEIQFEQKLNEMETTIEQSIMQEKYMWKSELDKCQKIAEAEIVQCEFEKQDLKTLLHSANELMRDKDETINTLQCKLQIENANYSKIREEFENELKETRKECSRIMTEKYNYQLTLNNTRSTVNILMERLKKSDTDVEILKNDLESLTAEKLREEARNNKLAEELVQLRIEADEYRNALAALRHSSLALEREVKEKESVFEKLMTSEEETLETVNKIGKLFNDKLEENISKYIDMYNEIKIKYDSRETYIKDMKALLDEFATGIELARIELDSKDKLLYELQQENKLFKMENMTYKFKCEQFEQCANDDKVSITGNADDEDGMIAKSVIAKIIHQLENGADAIESNDLRNTSLFCDEDKLAAENCSLKEKLVEKSKQIEFLKEMLEMENIHASENMELKKKLEDLKDKMQSVEKFAKETADKYTELASHQKTTKQMQINQLKESNLQLKNKIIQLQGTNKEQEHKINELNEYVEKTPTKLAHNVSLGTPKTPKKFVGKENHSPLVNVSNCVMSPARHNVLRPRN